MVMRCSNPPSWTDDPVRDAERYYSWVEEWSESDNYENEQLAREDCKYDKWRDEKWLSRE